MSLEVQMTLPKTRHIYSAVAKAIDSFGNRHHINARQHLAPLLGYRGEHAAIQLSNMLNSTTYNPASPKRMSVDHLNEILLETDDIAREKMLSAIVEPFGFTLQRDGLGDAKAFNVMDVFEMVVRLDRQHGDLSDAIGEALEDNSLQRSDCEKIRENIQELRRILREFESNLKGVEDAEE